MKRLLSPAFLPDGVVILSCSSHEERCRGLLNYAENWSPDKVFLFHYDDPNPTRDRNHQLMEACFRRIAPVVKELPFTEADAAASFKAFIGELGPLLRPSGGPDLLVDISVLTKRHLLMLLRWLDDSGLWDRLYLVYSEPGDYVVSEHIPLSYGLASLQQIPGFSACPDLSRPVHLVLFLGFEGDRALAVYEHTQPMRTTLVVPSPPYRPSWSGRTERLNRDLLALVGTDRVRRVDPLDPEATTAALRDTLTSESPGEFASIVAPLGTKPQTLGAYAYTRSAADPPAIVYAGPLRHNHDFFSDGIGPTWLLKAPHGV